MECMARKFKLWEWTVNLVIGNLVGDCGKELAAQGCCSESICFTEYGGPGSISLKVLPNSYISSQIDGVCGVREVVFLIISGV